ncbi:MAG: hypothetical protein V2J08_00870, partial [Desulfotignum sp.]|nr:hypothetical protein [Desulfotignum sp.]
MKLEKHHIDGLIKKYVRETLESDEEERLILGPVPDDVQKDLMESFKYFEDHTRYILRTNSLEEIEPVVDMRILEPNNLEADKDSYEYKKLSRETVKANIPIARIQMRREQGDYSDDNVDYYPGQEGPEVSQVTPQQEPEPQPSGPSLKTLLDKWFQENTKANSWSPRTHQRYDGNFRIILQILGDDCPIDSVDHGTVRDLKDTLLKLPAGMNKKTAFQGKTVPEIIELNETRIHAETLSVSTINAYLTTLGAFFKWCVGNDYMSQNYADGFKIKTSRTRKRPDETRQAFTTDHLNQIFNAPDYTEDK